MERQTEPGRHTPDDEQHERPRPPRPVEQRLLEGPRRSAGIDSHGQPVRLGEHDTSGHLVGYIDEHGLAWESLTEQLVAVHAGRLSEALALPNGDPQRDRLIDELLGRGSRPAARRRRSRRRGNARHPRTRPAPRPVTTNTRTGARG